MAGKNGVIQQMLWLFDINAIVGIWRTFLEKKKTIPVALEKQHCINNWKFELMLIDLHSKREATAYVSTKQGLKEGGYMQTEKPLF